MAAVIEPSENPGATAAQTEEYKPSMSEAQFDTLFIGQSHGYDFDFQKASEALAKTLKYRRDNNLDAVRDKATGMVQTQFPHAKFVLKSCPQKGHHKSDRMGQPLRLVLIGRADPHMMTQTVTPEQLIEFSICGLEARAAMLEKLSLETGTLVRACEIHDLAGLSFKHLDRTGISYFRGVTAIMQTHYPEFVGNILVINSPSVFDVIWRVVKGFLSPKTISKISILGNNYQQALFERVDPASLPDIHCGTCACEGGCIPFSDVDEGMVQVDIGRRSSHELRQPITAGQILSWCYRTAKNDIGVSIDFIPAGSKARITVEHMARRDCHTFMVQGTYGPAEKDGEIVFLFDNTYSIMTGKTLHYELSIGTAATGEEAEAAAAALTEEEKHDLEVIAEAERRMQAAMLEQPAAESDSDED